MAGAVLQSPAGESFVELQQRALIGVCRSGKRKRLAVDRDPRPRRSHPVILANLFGLTIKEVFKWKISYAGSFKLCYNQKSGKWICQNQ